MTAIPADKPLKKSQIKALKELGESGHFRVNWRPNLSPDAYRDLKERGLIEEYWTWASVTRPDVGITAEGVAALTADEARDDTDGESQGNGTEAI